MTLVFALEGEGGERGARRGGGRGAYGMGYVPFAMMRSRYFGAKSVSSDSGHARTTYVQGHGMDLYQDLVGFRFWYRRLGKGEVVDAIELDVRSDVVHEGVKCPHTLGRWYSRLIADMLTFVYSKSKWMFRLLQRRECMGTVCKGSCGVFIRREMVENMTPWLTYQLLTGCPNRGIGPW